MKCSIRMLVILVSVAVTPTVLNFSAYAFAYATDKAAVLGSLIAETLEFWNQLDIFRTSLTLTPEEQHDILDQLADTSIKLYTEVQMLAKESDHASADYQDIVHLITIFERLVPVLHETFDMHTHDSFVCTRYLLTRAPQLLANIKIDIAS